MADQIEFLIGNKARILMNKTTFQEKPYWCIAKHKKRDDGSWQYGQQTILIGENVGPDFAQALRAFADMIEGGGDA